MSLPASLAAILRTLIASPETLRVDPSLNLFLLDYFMRFTPVKVDGNIVRLWKDIGMYGSSGTARPALTTWLDFLHLPKR